MATTTAIGTGRHNHTVTILLAMIASIALGIGSFVVGRATDERAPQPIDPPPVHSTGFVPVQHGCFVVRGAPRAC